jgi:hypothetical protein
MAEREKGTFNFSNNLEVKKAAPLDARAATPNIADLTNGTLPFPYKGMMVSVTSEANSESNGLYILSGDDASILANWNKVNAEPVPIVDPVDPRDPVDPITDTLIQDDYIVEEYYNDPGQAKFQDSDNTPYYGTIDKWDVSQVTNLDDAFYGLTIGAGDLVNWDVSNVASMSSTFGGSEFSAEAGDDLNSWDVSSVADMSYAFAESNFNGDISAWDVRSLWVICLILRSISIKI